MAGLHRFAVPLIYFKKNFQEWIGMNIIKRYKKTIFVVSLLCAMFFAGRGVGYLTQDLGLPGINSVGSSRIAASENWGLGGYGDGVKPTGIASAEELKKYDAYFVGEGEEKVIYLTFDAGYENGNTEPIGAGIGKTDGGRRTLRRKPYIPPSGYVANIGYGILP